MNSRVDILEAQPKHLPLLPAIEQAAGMMFRNTAYGNLADGPNVSERVDASSHHVWIAAVDDAPVGFVIVRELVNSAHIHEIDVHPRCARRGLGRLLIDHLTGWARSHRMPAITLTTFDDVPWNGPYYARLGFVTLPPDDLHEELREILRIEKESGFPMEHRVAMRLDLS